MSDNPQLTAYLLGELSPAESTELEAQLAASPELRQEFDALRQTVAALESAFAQHVDTQPAVPAIDREKLHALLRSAVAPTVERTPTSVPPGPGGPGYGSRATCRRATGRRWLPRLCWPQPQYADQPVATGSSPERCWWSAG